MREQFELPVKILNRLPKDKKYKLLDVGASTKFLEKFIPKNVKYHSLDYTGKHDWIVDLDKKKIPIKSGTFDIIVCLETLEHLIDPERVMEELLRIGKKDAIFILSLPNDYNFVLRFYYLLGKKVSIQKPFKTIKEHLHIHTPRVKDIIDFFSKYIETEEIYYAWSSRTGLNARGIKGQIYKVIDDLINLLAKIYPSLFSRLVSVKGRKLK